MYHIFLSYSRKDNKTMQRVKRSFLNAGLNVWTDEGIEVGTQSWKRAIQKAILETSCIVCLASPDALESRWVQEELDYAELHEKPRFLVLVRGEQKTAIPFGFATHQFTDIRPSKNYEDEIQRLVETIHQKLGLETLAVSAINLASIPLVTGSKTKALLPQPFDWCEIPEGKVILGKGWNEKAHSVGKTFQVSTFLIAKYPVTNSQFAKFVKARGYKHSQWWTDIGWRESQDNIWTKPKFWNNSKWNNASYPVVGVSWYEATAFCLWVSEMTGEKIMLPTEQQWQRAAQGGDGRAYPWGNQWDAHLCNNNLDHKEISEGKTTPVKEYEYKGESPAEAVDMAGNVWEWCRTPYELGTNESIDGTSWRCIRGGSWVEENITDFRVDHRFSHPPDSRGENIGFRICLNLD
jgi:formylglycine-generating enzyme required for sulfatase activity